MINLARLAFHIEGYKQVKPEYKTWHLEGIEKAIDQLPKGSGIDSGMKLDLDKSNRWKIIFEFEYHHMNEDGYYDGWTSHKLTLKPTFDSIEMHITGRDRNQLKDYLYDMFSDLFVLDQKSKEVICEQ